MAKVRLVPLEHLFVRNLFIELHLLSHPLLPQHLLHERPFLVLQRTAHAAELFVQFLPRLDVEPLEQLVQLGLLEFFA